MSADSTAQPTSEPAPTISSLPAVVVTGDFVIDHHTYEGKRRHFVDQDCRGVCVKKELGGAALVFRLLKELQARPVAAWRSYLAVDERATPQGTSTFGSAASGCHDEPFSAYAFWRPYRLRQHSRDLCWRVAEAMGFGGGPLELGRWPWDPAPGLPSAPKVLVIADGGMGFRARRNCAHWGVPVRDERLRELAGLKVDPAAREPDWIVLKMSAPAGHGDLWRELSRYHADRLVVVVSSEELRRADVRLGRSLSWEQTLEEVQRAILHNPDMRALTQCRHLVVSFGTEGALWFHRLGHAPLTATVVFDPKHVEGEAHAGVEGSVYGSLSCLTATIAAALVLGPSSSAPATAAGPDMESGLRRGLRAMRFLREFGHGDATKDGAGFPAAALARAILEDGAPGALHVRTFPFDGPQCPVHPDWAILALHGASMNQGDGGPLFGIARRVLMGGSGLLEAPVLQIGGFVTADRGEIEALRSLRQLVDRYLRVQEVDKPLSIGVFGPPGSGKSFAVRELARDLLKDRMGWLEFNLSQFSGPDDLIGALHQVRDKTLEGKVPVAFFDEFDSQGLCWLKYLLAPMQDGRFQEGQISHPVGRCLFFFAGGTSETFEDFARKSLRSGAGTDQARVEHFVGAKGPDFASRLDGRLNVVGPNPRRAHPGSAADIFFPVRRALFIRTNLRCADDEPLAVQPSLATALLEIPAYSHGSRSLAKLLEPFWAARRERPSTTLTLSMLPPRDQLALQVEVEPFEGLIRRSEDACNRLGVDRLGEAVHRFYREQGRKEGWIKAHHDRDFADLSSFDQASNRAAAARLPGILALVGLSLEPGTANKKEVARIRKLLEFHLELLAEAEHDGWMRWHFDNGWSHAAGRDDATQRHDLLSAYSKLKPKERSKDQNSVRHYPEIAGLAGLKIVQITK